MKQWGKLQSILNDIIGFIVTIWGMVLLTVKTPDWTYAFIVLIGVSAIVGKQVVSNIPLIGGGSSDEGGKENQVDS